MSLDFLLHFLIIRIRNSLKTLSFTNFNMLLNSLHCKFSFAFWTRSQLQRLFFLNLNLVLNFFLEIIQAIWFFFNNFFWSILFSFTNFFMLLYSILSKFSPTLITFNSFNKLFLFNFLLNLLNRFFYIFVLLCKLLFCLLTGTFMFVNSIFIEFTATSHTLSFTRFEVFLFYSRGGKPLTRFNFLFRS